MIQLEQIKWTDDGGIDPDVYEMLRGWWIAHGWPGVHPAVLRTPGALAWDEDKTGGKKRLPVAAGFLYMSNSTGVGWIEWIVSNPEATPMQIHRGIMAIIDHLSDHAKSLGYGVILTYCRQPSLARVFESAGFEKTDENVIHLLKVLK